MRSRTAGMAYRVRCLCWQTFYRGIEPIPLEYWIYPRHSEHENFASLEAQLMDTTNAVQAVICKGPVYHNTNNHGPRKQFYWCIWCSWSLVQFIVLNSAVTNLSKSHQWPTHYAWQDWYVREIFWSLCMPPDYSVVVRKIYLPEYALQSKNRCRNELLLRMVCK